MRNIEPAECDASEECNETCSTPKACQTQSRLQLGHMKKSNPFCLLETMHAVVVEVVRKNTPYEKDVWVYRRTPRARKGKVGESMREWSK